MKPRNYLRRASLLGATLALFAGSASAQLSLSSEGYFRAGPGATQKNANRACYGLADADFKYRLGNECDFYGEFLFSGTITRKDSSDVYKIHFMPTIFKGNASDSNDAAWETAQMWVEASGMDFLPDATFWAGKRYHRGQDIHIVDTYFEKLDGTGAGASIPALGGKLEMAFYRSDSTTEDANGNDNPGSRGNLWLRDVPVNEGGKINVLATVTKGQFTGGTGGFGVSVRHTQSGLPGDSSNHIWLQFAEGSTRLDGNFGTLTESRDTKKWRIVDGYQFQATPNLGGQLIGMFERRNSDSGDATITSLGGRVSYALTRNFKLLGEVGLDRVRPEGGKTANLTKFTFAPTISAGRGFWERPELRLYVTHATWNKAANAQAGTDGLTGLGDGKTSGTSYGIQAEIWW